MLLFSPVLKYSHFLYSLFSQNLFTFAGSVAFDCLWFCTSQEATEHFAPGKFAIVCLTLRCDAMPAMMAAIEPAIDKSNIY
jgi:hypothetical protein